MAETKTASSSADRPLSPHWQIYRWPLTMMTSITHRVTGLASALGLALVTIWLVAVSYGSDGFAAMQDVLASVWGRLILFGFTLALVYHLLNGIRHLAWDAGWGFSLKTARSAGILVILGTLIVTVAIWVLAYWMAGAL